MLPDLRDARRRLRFRGAEQRVSNPPRVEGSWEILRRKGEGQRPELDLIQLPLQGGTIGYYSGLSRSGSLNHNPKVIRSQNYRSESLDMLKPKTLKFE